MFKKLKDLLAPSAKVYFIYTHNNAHNRFAFGLKANTEISYFSASALKGKFPFRFLKIEGEKPSRLRAIQPHDVVIGHIGKTFLQAAERTRRVIAFYPWAGHEDRSESKRFNCLNLKEELHYLERAAAIILLTSEYNKRTYVEQNSNYWCGIFQKLNREKSVRFVHQPIDLTLFPRIKTNYCTSNFLYVGNEAHMKGLEEAKKLAASGNRAFHIYGVGDKKLDNLNKKAVTELASMADFFLQPGMWEGQCVAILEAAARGFIPIVTEETGYPYSHPFLLKYGDFDYNKKIIFNLLHTPAEERKMLADALHQQLREDSKHNCWKQLTDVLVEEVSRLRA